MEKTQAISIVALIQSDVAYICVQMHARRGTYQHTSSHTNTHNPSTHTHQRAFTLWDIRPHRSVLDSITPTHCFPEMVAKIFRYKRMQFWHLALDLFLQALEPGHLLSACLRFSSSCEVDFLLRAILKSSASCVVEV